MGVGVDGGAVCSPSANNVPLLSQMKKNTRNVEQHHGKAGRVTSRHLALPRCPAPVGLHLLWHTTALVADGLATRAAPAWTWLSPTAIVRRHKAFSVSWLTLLKDSTTSGAALPLWHFVLFLSLSRHRPRSSRADVASFRHKRTHNDVNVRKVAPGNAPRSLGSLPPPPGNLSRSSSSRTSPMLVAPCPQCQEHQHHGGSGGSDSKAPGAGDRADRGRRGVAGADGRRDDKPRRLFRWIRCGSGGTNNSWKRCNGPWLPNSPNKKEPQPAPVADGRSHSSDSPDYPGHRHGRGG